MTSCRRSTPLPLQEHRGSDVDLKARPDSDGESAAAEYRQLAGNLGLDMAAFDAALTDPRTMRRVKTDMVDGAALGIGSPPSFLLLDGKEIQATTLAEFRQAIANAAAR